MVPIDTQIAASQVLQAFHYHEVFLFLGSSFATAGLLSIALCVLRRRFDALLVWLGIFAGLYGLRIWLQARTMHIVPEPNLFFHRLPWAIHYLIPIPAFPFLRVSEFLRRGAKVIAVVAAAVFLCMFTGTIAFGPLPLFYAINGFLVTGVLLILVVQSLGKESRDRDSAVVRIDVAPVIFTVVAFSLSGSSCSCWSGSLS